MKKSGNYLLVSSLACLLPPASTAPGKPTLDILKYCGQIAGELVTYSGFLFLCAQYNFFPSKMGELSFMVLVREFPT